MKDTPHKNQKIEKLRARGSILKEKPSKYRCHKFSDRRYGSTERFRLPGSLEKVEDLLASGGSVMFHRKGGLGRTGTMLAAFLLGRGADLVAALDEIQIIERRFVQSQEQRDFLEEYARAARPSRYPCPRPEPPIGSIAPWIPNSL